MNEPDHLICYRAELKQTQCLNFRCQQNNGEIIEAIAVDNGDGIVAYKNSCPHQQVQLSWGQDDLYNIDGDHLFCIFHGARFQMNDGLCVRGPCLGQYLQPITLEVTAEAVLLGDEVGRLIKKKNCNYSRAI